MEVRLSQALGPVRVALDSAAQEAGRRRLRIAGIRCAPKCSGCCRRLVRLSVAEAMLMYEHLLEHGLWEGARKAALEQDRIARMADPVSWFKMNRPCPALSPEGLCGAYPVRPAACSTHFVASDPKLCDPWYVGSGQYESADMLDVLARFKGRIDAGLEGHGILRLELPMPTALLLAERVSINTGLDLQQAVSMLFNET